MHSLTLTKIYAYARLMRLERPVGTLLLAWSSFWGLLLAGSGQPPAWISAIIILGTWTMRSAGCVFNDLADRNFDGHVKRTTHRPLATGEVSVNEALGLAVGLLLFNFLLVLLLNWQSVVLAVLLAAVAILYPFCKRFLPTPQAMLGIAFASPILIAHTAILETITWAGFFMFLGSAFWAMVYDTYYALVDRDDDIPLGLQSTAILAQGKEHLFIGTMALVMLVCLLISGILAGLNGWYYLGLGFATALMVYQLYATRTLERDACFGAFSNNNWVGAFILLGLFLSYLP